MKKSSLIFLLSLPVMLVAIARVVDWQGVEHWDILKREVFIAAWIIVALSYYLFDITRLFTKGRFAMSKARIVFAVLTLGFAIYLIPGLVRNNQASLKLLSGFAPPMSYSVYGKTNIGKGLEPTVVNDFDKALQLARLEGKPLLLDFTGWACINCRKMEEQVWSKQAVANLISGKYVLVSLYVDDRTKLPAEKQLVYKTQTDQQKKSKQQEISRRLSRRKIFTLTQLMSRRKIAELCCGLYT